MFCTKCGQQVEDGAVFCTRCGNRLQGAPEQPQVSAAPAYPGYYAQGYPVAQPRKSHKGLIIGLSVGAGVLAILAVVLFVFILPGGSGDIAGMWYEQTGYGGTVEFLRDGTVNYEVMGYPVSGEYTYDASTRTGQMTIDLMGVSQSVDFELEDNLIVIEGAYFSRDYVEQQNISDMLDDFGLDGSDLNGLDMSDFNFNDYDMGDLSDYNMDDLFN